MSGKNGANGILTCAEKRAKLAIEKAVEYAKVEVPVDTGSLYKTIRWEKIKNQGKDISGYRLVMGGKDYRGSRSPMGKKGKLVNYALIAEIKHNPTLTRAILHAMRWLKSG